MTDSIRGFTELDRTVHEPARLAILTVLAGCETADFVFLHRITGLTRGNLSNHISRLEEAGMVGIEKGYQGKTPITTISLTAKGRQAIEGHWIQLEELRKQAHDWDPQDLGP